MLVSNMIWLNDLTKRRASDKILRDRAFNIAKTPKYHGYKRGLASMVCKYFDKQTFGGGIKNETTSNNELAEELHKPIIRKLKKKKIMLTFYR